MPNAHRPSLAQPAGFTLLEVIIVFAVLAVLSGIVVGVFPGVLEGQRKTRARAELVMIQSALEAYKTKFGQYPVTPDSLGDIGLEDDAQYLYAACNGLIDPEEKVTQGRPWLNLSALTTENASRPDFSDESPDLAAKSNRILDPWGNPYRYLFDPKDANWKNYNYVLYSEGPDGLSSAVPADGIPKPSDAHNADNLYAP